MEQHYFIGVHIGMPAAKLAAPFIRQQQLDYHYKLLTHEEDYHLTFLYIGALTANQKEELQKTLQLISRETASFSIQMTGFHYFGNPETPRVVYLVVDANERLSDLQERIFEASVPYIATHVKNRFVPHITIGKKRTSSASFQLSPSMIEPTLFSVRSFELFTIHPNKLPKYQVVQTFSLQ